MTRRMPSVCSERPSSSRIGKKYQPWWATNQRISRLRCRVAMAGRHGDRGQRDVGVGALLVRVGVVAVVLALPPAVADPDQQVRDDQADPVVPPPGLEDLPVGGVVAEERDLGHQNREDHGAGELPPAVADAGRSPPPRRPGRATAPISLVQ